jgi:hypothetical protein
MAIYRAAEPASYWGVDALKSSGFTLLCGYLQYPSDYCCVYVCRDAYTASIKCAGVDCRWVDMGVWVLWYRLDGAGDADDVCLVPSI